MGYTELRLDLILATLRRLQSRIQERFPDSGLSRIAAELHRVAEETGPILERARRPNLLVRVGVGIGLALVLAFLVGLVVLIRSLSFELGGLGAFMQGTESATQNVIFLAIVVYFLVTLEGRIKRRAALQELHKLRSVIHIVDMHQLTKDPDHLVGAGKETASSPERKLPRFEMSRYLDYCAELLSLSSKLAALHLQSVNDPVVLDAVSDVEELASDLAGRIWQKIMIVDRGLAGEG